MAVTLEVAALNMALAMICGALIGSERQMRHRMAGVRTNALVALGAAGFVVFSALYPQEVNPTRVAAQVVSGIGFLGAGVIFRHGFTVHGMNTAATLWCSAAVGILMGGGWMLYGLVMTGLIIFVNVGLRPVVKWIKRKTHAGMPMGLDYRLRVTTDSGDEEHVRALVLQHLALPGFHLNGIDSRRTKKTDDIVLEVHISTEEKNETLLKTAVLPMIGDPKVRGLTWETSAET